jgi:hypothetical protein
VDVAGAGVDADVGLHPEAQLVALQRQSISGSRAPSAFFVEVGAAMIVVSTMAPSLGDLACVRRLEHAGGALATHCAWSAR